MTDERGAYNMDNLKENVETQQPKRDEDSTSTVKTPLVDALRSYFDQPISGGPLRYGVCPFQIEATDRG